MVAPLRARLMELFRWEVLVVMVLVAALVVVLVVAEVVEVTGLPREMVEGDYPDRRVVAASDPARHGGHLATGWC